MTRYESIKKSFYNLAILIEDLNSEANIVEIEKTILELYVFLKHLRGLEIIDVEYVLSGERSSERVILTESDKMVIAAQITASRKSETDEPSDDDIFNWRSSSTREEKTTVYRLLVGILQTCHTKGIERGDFDIARNALELKHYFIKSLSAHLQRSVIHKVILEIGTVGVLNTVHVWERHPFFIFSSAFDWYLLLLKMTDMPNSKELIDLFVKHLAYVVALTQDQKDSRIYFIGNAYNPSANSYASMSLLSVLDSDNLNLYAKVLEMDRITERFVDPTQLDILLDLYLQDLKKLPRSMADEIGRYQKKLKNIIAERRVIFFKKLLKCLFSVQGANSEKTDSIKVEMSSFEILLLTQIAEMSFSQNYWYQESQSLRDFWQYLFIRTNRRIVWSLDIQKDDFVYIENEIEHINKMKIFVKTVESLSGFERDIKWNSGFSVLKQRLDELNDQGSYALGVYDLQKAIVAPMMFELEKWAKFDKVNIQKDEYNQIEMDISVHINVLLSRIRANVPLSDVLDFFSISVNTHILKQVLLNRDAFNSKVLIAEVIEYLRRLTSSSSLLIFTRADTCMRFLESLELKGFSPDELDLYEINEIELGSKNIKILALESYINEDYCILVPNDHRIHLKFTTSSKNNGANFIAISPKMLTQENSAKLTLLISPLSVSSDGLQIFKLL